MIGEQGWCSGESARARTRRHVGWVCCWFSSLLREVFLWVLRFSPLLKNQHFQIPIRCGEWPHTVKGVCWSRHGIMCYTNFKILYSQADEKHWQFHYKTVFLSHLFVRLLLAVLNLLPDLEEVTLRRFVFLFALMVDNLLTFVKAHSHLWRRSVSPSFGHYIVISPGIYQNLKISAESNY